MNCNDAMTALVASLEEGTPMTAAQREHVRTCERCRPLLDSAKQFESALEQQPVPVPRVDDAVAAAEAELIHARTRRAIYTLLGIGMALAVAVGLALLFPLRDEWHPGLALWAVTMAALISAGFFVPILGIIYLLRDFGRRRMYKRLKPGRMISGVCLGLAERMNVEVRVVRIVFVLILLFGGGLGFWLYVGFDVAMPVHPDDRQHMLRFRWKRWLARRSGHAEHDAG
jgi:phage shock protein PspC (stress-responsive transcriptional regulator)